MRTLPNGWQTLGDSLTPVVLVELYIAKTPIRLATHKIYVQDEDNTYLFLNRITKLNKFSYGINLQDGSGIGSIPQFDFEVDNTDNAVWNGDEIWKNKTCKVYVSFLELAENNTIEWKDLFQLFEGIVDDFRIELNRLKVVLLSRWALTLRKRIPDFWLLGFKSVRQPISFGRKERYNAVYFDFDGTQYVTRKYALPFGFSRVHSVHEGGKTLNFDEYGIDASCLDIIDHDLEINSDSMLDKLTLEILPTYGPEEVRDYNRDTGREYTLPPDSSDSLFQFGYNGFLEYRKFFLILEGYMLMQEGEFVDVGVRFTYEESWASEVLATPDMPIYDSLPDASYSPGAPVNFRRQFFGLWNCGDNCEIGPFSLSYYNHTDQDYFSLDVREVRFALWIPPPKAVLVVLDGVRFELLDRIPPGCSPNDIIENPAHIIEFVVSQLLGCSLDVQSVDEVAVRNHIKMALTIYNEEGYALLRKIAKEGRVIFFNNGVENKLRFIEVLNGQPVDVYSPSDYTTIKSKDVWDIYSRFVVEYRDRGGFTREKILSPKRCDFPEICEYQARVAFIEQYFPMKELRLKLDFVHDEDSVAHFVRHVIDWHTSLRSVFNISFLFKKELFSLEVGDTIEVHLPDGTISNVIVSEIEIDFKKWIWHVKGIALKPIDETS